jgi:hypothetical protein
MQSIVIFRDMSNPKTCYSLLNLVSCGFFVALTAFQMFYNWSILRSHNEIATKALCLDIFQLYSFSSLIPVQFEIFFTGLRILNGIKCTFSKTRNKRTQIILDSTNVGIFALFTAFSYVSISEYEQEYEWYLKNANQCEHAQRISMQIWDTVELIQVGHWIHLIAGTLLLFTSLCKEYLREMDENGAHGERGNHTKSD